MKITRVGLDIAEAGFRCAGWMSTVDAQQQPEARHRTQAAGEGAPSLCHKSSSIIDAMVPHGLYPDGKIMRRHRY